MECNFMIEWELRHNKFSNHGDIALIHVQSGPGRVVGLTPKQRLVYQLNRRQGIAQNRIALELGVRPESICRLLQRADERIGRLLKRFEGTDPELLLAAILNGPIHHRIRHREALSA
jgi:hypothetical protein